MWGLLILVLFQLVGTALMQLGVPLPGPVLGMLLLLVALLLIGRVPDALRQTSGQLLKYLPLLLIPPSVGIMAQWDVITSNFLAISVALLGSLLVSIPLTAWVLQTLVRRRRAGE